MGRTCACLCVCCLRDKTRRGASLARRRRRASFKSASGRRSRRTGRPGRSPPPPASLDVDGAHAPARPPHLPLHTHRLLVTAPLFLLTAVPRARRDATQPSSSLESTPPPRPKSERAPVSPPFLSPSGCGHDDARLRHGACVVGAGAAFARRFLRRARPTNRPRAKTDPRSSSLRPRVAARSLSRARARACPTPCDAAPLAVLRRSRRAQRVARACRSLLACARDAARSSPPPLLFCPPASAHPPPRRPAPPPQKKKTRKKTQKKTRSNPKSSSCARAPTPPRASPSS